MTKSLPESICFLGLCCFYFVAVVRNEVIILQTPANITACIGSSLSITCRFCGIPNINKSYLKWHKMINGSALIYNTSEESNVRIHQLSSGNLTLHLQNVSVEDSGNYSCEVGDVYSNAHGSGTVVHIHGNEKGVLCSTEKWTTTGYVSSNPSMTSAGFVESSSFPGDSISGRSSILYILVGATSGGILLLVLTIILVVVKHHKPRQRQGTPDPDPATSIYCNDTGFYTAVIPADRSREDRCKQSEETACADDVYVNVDSNRKHQNSESPSSNKVYASVYKKRQSQQVPFKEIENPLYN